MLKNRRQPRSAIDLPGMCGGQGAEGRRRGDLEPGTELLEAPGRQLRAARRELQQARHLLAAEVGHGRPEPVEGAPEVGRAAVHDVVRPEVRHAVLAGPTK